MMKITGIEIQDYLRNARENPIVQPNDVPILIPTRPILPALTDWGLLKEVSARFWKKVKYSDCWEWQGAKRPDGYGVFSLNNQTVLAHRLSVTLTAYRDIPNGYLILHSCRNQRCVNPNHLRIGDHNENMRDLRAHNEESHALESP